MLVFPAVDATLGAGRAFVFDGAIATGIRPIPSEDQSAFLRHITPAQRLASRADNRTI